MTSYKIDTDSGIEFVDADSLNHEGGYLILLRDGNVAAVFAKWNHVIEDSE